MVPTLEEGMIVFKPSVAVKAALNGRFLVVDEADKAPLEVVCILKALAEDQELVLNDGRKLISKINTVQTRCVQETRAKLLSSMTTSA